MNVVVYTKSNCSNCTTAKALLNSKGIGFEERSIEGELWATEFFQDYPEARQMPQCFISSQRVGGLAGLQAALKELGL